VFRALIYFLRMRIRGSLFVNYEWVFRRPVHFFVFFFGSLECVSHTFTYVAHFVFLRDVWIRTQRAVVVVYGSGSCLDTTVLASEK
jgi:hypothetical protein